MYRLKNAILVIFQKGQMAGPVSTGIQNVLIGIVLGTYKHLWILEGRIRNGISVFGFFF